MKQHTITAKVYAILRMIWLGANKNYIFGHFNDYSTNGVLNDDTEKCLNEQFQDILGYICRDCVKISGNMVVFNFGGKVFDLSNEAYHKSGSADDTLIGAAHTIKNFMYKHGYNFWEGNNELGIISFRFANDVSDYSFISNEIINLMAKKTDISKVSIFENIGHLTAIREKNKNIDNQMEYLIRNEMLLAYDQKHIDIIVDYAIKLNQYNDDRDLDWLLVCLSIVDFLKVHNKLS